MHAARANEETAMKKKLTVVYCLIRHYCHDYCYGFVSQKKLREKIDDVSTTMQC